MKAASAWAENGKIGESKLVVNKRETFPPFSDLNVHCGMVVNEFSAETSAHWATMGTSYGIFDRATHYIVDGTIIIFADSFPKLEEMHRQRDMDFNQSTRQSAVAMHEYGHFYGLDHEFDKDKNGKPRNKSIMSYDAVFDITPFDFSSIETLYSELEIILIRDAAELGCKDLKSNTHRKAFEILEAKGILTASAGRNCETKFYFDIDYERSRDLSQSGMNDIHPLKYFIKLNDLELSGNNITDLSPLASLKNLTALNISKNKIQNLTPIAAHEKLEDVKLEGNPISDCPTEIKSKTLKTKCEEVAAQNKREAGIDQKHI